MTRAAGYIIRYWPAVIAAWLAAVALALLVPPSFEEVAAFDEAIFLPADSPALQADALAASGWPDDHLGRSATLAFVRPSRPLDEEDARYARAVIAWLEGPEAPAAFGTVSTHLDAPGAGDGELSPAQAIPAGALASDDGHVWLVTIALESHAYAPETREGVRALRAHLAAAAGPEGLDTYLTGTAGVAVDEDAAIRASVARTQVLSIVLVVALLLWVFRAPLAPLVPLITVGAAYLVSLGVVSALAGAGMDVSYLFETFSIVIVFGAGTDYCLLIMARYGEELRLGQRVGLADTAGMRRATLAATMAVLAGVVASSAASTMVGFSAQSLAEFGLFRTLGPALAVTVFIALLAGVTLTPALVRLFGGALFWPSATGPGPTGARPPLIAGEPLDRERAGR
ncbi:MAG: MMPL family transporter [Egibacteraceae bacterium]